MYMDNLLILWICLLGLVIGSFLNVVIYRLPLGTMLKSSRSACTKCGIQLKWYHNIPIFSYLFLLGKCAYCKKTISFRYPLVELCNAILYLYFYLTFDISYNFIVFSILSSMLLAIIFIDYDHQIIPDSITLSGMVIGLVASLLPGGMGIVDSLIGLLVGGGTLYFIALLGDWLFKKESMGGGDIKMAGMLGAFLGWQKGLLIFLSSAVIGLFVSIIIMFISEKFRQERVIPFGPFLAIAAFLAIIYGENIINFYLGYVVGLAM